MIRAGFHQLSIIVMCGAVCACGRLHYEVGRADAAVRDAGPPDGPMPDAFVPDGGDLDSSLSDDLGPMDADSPDAITGDSGPAPSGWGAPMPVAGILTAGGEYQPTLTRDGLRICFTSNRGGGGSIDLFCADRATVADVFSAPYALDSVNAPAATDRMPALSADGSELFFVSDRGGNDDIFRATWSVPRASYQLDGVVVELTTLDDEGGPELSPSGREIFFDRRPGGASSRILVATRSSAGAIFGAPVEIAPLVSSADDSEPAIGDDGDTMVFCTTRVAPARPVSSTLFMSVRVGSVFGPPTPVEALELELRGVCSPALVRGDLYYNTVLPSGPGGSDIVIARPL